MPIAGGSAQALGANAAVADGRCSFTKMGWFCRVFGHQCHELRVAGQLGGVYCPRCNSYQLLEPPAPRKPAAGVPDFSDCWDTPERTEAELRTLEAVLLPRYGVTHRDALVSLDAAGGLGDGPEEADWRATLARLEWEG